MVCKNCGNEMPSDARFCPSCGAVNSPDLGSGLPQGAAPYGASAPSWEGPEGGGKKKKTGLFIGIGAAVVAVIAVVAVVASGLFGSPKGVVEKAFAKTAAAYLAAEEKLGMPDTAQWQKDQKISQRVTLELTGINSDLIGYDLSNLMGLGLQMSTGYDGAGRKLSFDLNAYWENTVLLSFEMLAEDAGLYFGLPQFLGDDYYGVNTETLGADLAELTGDDSVKDISFNLFDLVDKALELADPEAMEQSFKEANKGLLEAMEVKKLGARTLDLNGTETKTTAYHAVIPEAALYQYVDTLETVLSALNYYDLYEEIYQSMGIPADEIDEIMSALEEFDVYGDLADDLRDAVDEMGDLELDICISDGYVSAILYEGTIDGTDVELSVYLGGGQEYVDDISAVVEVDGSTIEVKSAGDHGLKNGVYTDETTVRIRDGSSTLARVTSDMSLDPSKQEDNFQWKLGVDSSGLSVFVLETEGNVAMSENSLSIDLGEVSVRAIGMEICTLMFEYDVSNSGPGPLDVASPVMIAGMSEQDLMKLGMDIQSNAVLWVSEMGRLFTSRLPSDLLWAITGGF